LPIASSTSFSGAFASGGSSPAAAFVNVSSVRWKSRSLAREEAEDVWLCDADAFGDALDGSAVQAPERELVDGGVDQRVASLGGGDALTRGGFC
jgi:hypothetical protein